MACTITSILGTISHIGSAQSWQVLQDKRKSVAGDYGINAPGLMTFSQAGILSPIHPLPQQRISPLGGLAL